MHIEQGPVLENLGKSIGVVTGIAAPTRCLVDITGRTGHVGTVPMKARKDALLAACEIITGVEDVVRRTDDTGVGTVGRVEIEPNSVTAIPGHVKLWIDLRYLNDEKKKTCVTGINKLITDIKNERELKITLKTLTDERSTKLSNRVINTIRQATESFGYAYHEIVSGAMHDAAHIAKITDAGMIFVPCKSGISHAPEESADPKHINAGLNVLYKTLVKLANE
jgi:N-carbamoyl-L-amino-acid hydrolase